MASVQNLHVLLEPAWVSSGHFPLTLQRHAWFTGGFKFPVGVNMSKTIYVNPAKCIPQPITTKKISSTVN